MTIRWLTGTVYDSTFQLSRQQRAEVLRSANVHSRSCLWVVAALFAGAVVLMYFAAVPAIDFANEFLRPRVVAAVVAIGVMDLAYAAGSVLLLTRLYVPSIRLAMREHGYDVCLRCGYWLRGLGSEISNCPECGAARRSLAESATGGGKK